LKEDGMAKLGLLINESGLTSVAFLAVGRMDRAAAQALYARIAAEVEEFERQVGERLHGTDTPREAGQQRESR
jgi:hypothetical protein